jgi:deoxyribodipyrimidine photo-lyase
MNDNLQNKSNKPVTIFWFRRDLRLNDNHGLYEALNTSNNVLPIFIFDKNILNELKNKKDKRVAFIHQALANINDELLKIGSSLLVVHDEPMNAFKNICENYVVENVFTNHDYEPYATQRDQQLTNWFLSKNISFKTFKDQVIFEKSEVMKSDGSPYTIFTPYSKLWKQKLGIEGIPTFPSEKLQNNFIQTAAFHIPTLPEIGFEETNTGISSTLIDKNIISNYHITRNTPSIHGTTNLSVHIRFGTVSVRALTKTALELNEQWLNELIWREFFMMILYHFPKVVTNNFKSKYDVIKWRNNEAEFKLWCNGETGYEIVDAGMKELNETGFMHNRVRMIVAGFLTKHLLIDWRWGEAYFAEKLLDYELSSNNGNWQWSAGCGCDSAPYFRIFNPSEQTKKFDPERKYIKKWLGNSPLIFPMVEHTFARQRALDVFKSSLAENDN